MICIHHNDLDGKCAAAIVGRLGLVEFIETDYKDPLDVKAVTGQDVVLVDFSYKPDTMLELINLAKSVTWIDHHATAKDYPYQDLPGLRNFNDKEMSGCELTWLYYFYDIPIPIAVLLIGDYDKWALKMLESKAFYEGMKLQKNHPSDPLWNILFNPKNRIWNEIVEQGEIAIKYRDSYCSDLCRNFGYEALLEGYRIYACNQYMFGSGGFVHLFHQYPLCVAYIHDGQKYTVSLYSETVDVGAIAKKYGGGGHKGAAGFICDDLPFRRILWN